MKDIQLYGKDSMEGVVGVKKIQDDEARQQCHMMIWYRDNEELKTTTRRFYPFFYLNDIKHLHGFDSDKFQFMNLQGTGYYRTLVVLKSWNTMWKAVRHVKDSTGHNRKSGYPDEMHIVTNPEQQFLMQSGITFFKGMVPNDIHRVQFDIEAYNRRGFPNAKRRNNPIFIIGVNDNRGYKTVLHTAPQGINVEGGVRMNSEEELLRNFVNLIKVMDPDVFVGHNIYSFDIPYIHERCKLHGIKFDLGRDGSEPEFYDTRIRFAERDIEYPAYHFTGRSVLDTLFMVMGYDVIKRDMPGYSLKVAAQHFGFAPEDREYIRGDEIAKTWDEDPGRVLRYAFDDVIETDNLYGHLSGSVFETTKMIPMPFDRVSRAGTAAKIESLMIREYLREKFALPEKDRGAPEAAIDEDDLRNMEVGGYTDIFATGIYDKIVYADVASLYPSIMLQYSVEPMGDDLKLFRNLLQQLTDLRFEAKGEMTEWKNKVKALEKELHNYNVMPEGQSVLYGGRPKKDIEADLEHAKHMQESKDNQQGSYKILINSFFGALGFKFFVFNDFKEADRVTVIGQRLLNMIMKLIRRDEKHGAKVIEVDTDGVLAIPPKYVYTKDDKEDQRRAEKYAEEWNYLSALENDYQGGLEALDDEAYVKALTAEMPEGIIIDFDGRADVMMSYKKKNYALREPGKDKPKIKGGSLVSRLVEPFRLDFVRETIIALLDKDTARIHEIYKRYYMKVIGSDWTPEEFAKTSTIKDPIETYLKKIELSVGNGGRNRAAAYELAIKQAEETGIPAQTGDRISYYTAQKTKTYKNGKVVPKPKSSVRVFEDAEFAEEWDKENPDEHTDWYLDKLIDSAKKFEVFFTEYDWNLLFSPTDEEGVDYADINIQNKDVPKTPLKVIIAEGRDIEDMFWVERAISGCKFLRKIEDGRNPHGYRIGEVVSGKAPGADSLGEQWAKENGVHVEPFPADWDNIDDPKAVVRERKDGSKYNVIAGHLRNEKMAEYADALIAIWDGRSKGTLDMIRRAKNQGLKVHVSKVRPYSERDPK